MNIKKSDKFENGKKVGEIYRLTIIADQCTDGTINVNVYDGGEVDWREIVDGATMKVEEIEIPVP